LRSRPFHSFSRPGGLSFPNRELIVTTQQLCKYLHAAETKVARLESLSEDSIAPELKKRKRLKTTPDQITSGDDAKYVGLEERAAKRVAKDDSDYEDALSENLSD